MNSEQFDREFDLEKVIRDIETDPDFISLMEKLGSDYDSNGVPYWENNE